MKGGLTGKKYLEGMSTLEILIAFSVFILVISSVILVSYGSQSMILDAELSEGALYRAKEALELTTTQDFDSLHNEFSQDGIYDKEISVKHITNFAKEIESKVSWDEGGRNKKVILSEIVINRKDTEGADSCDLFLFSDWLNPSEVESISNPAFIKIKEIDVLNKKIYVATNSNIALDSDFHVVDISDLSNIHIVSINTGPGLNTIQAVGKYAYAGNTSINAQLQVIDISNSNNPEVKIYYKLPIYGPTEDRVATSIFYANKKVYLGTDKSEGMEFNIIDVSSPLNPIWVGSFETDTLINDIHVVGDIAYLATATEKQMRILDVSNPSNIKEIGDIFLSQFLTQSGKSLYPLGNIVYFGRTWGGSDVSNHEFHVLDSISEVSVGSKKIGKSVNDIFIRGNMAFLATLFVNEEFQVWDVKDPVNIIKKSSLDIGGNGISLDCEDDKFYFATPSEIKIIEAGTP